MAITQTTRFGLYRWSAGADAYTRVQQDANSAAVETSAAGRLTSTIGTRPAAGATNEGFFHFASDTKAVSYSDGAAWYSVGFAGDSDQIAIPADLFT